MLKSKKLFLLAAVVWIIIVLFIWWQTEKTNKKIISPADNFEQIEQKNLTKEKPLIKYEFENLKKRGGIASKIILERQISKNPAFTSYIFSYQSEGRKITGLTNIPNDNQKKKKKKKKVVVMIRGYVDREVYQPGMGTQKAAEFFAKNGFITLAPDFLGYGESEMPPDNVWEERFLRLTSVLDLLSSVKSLPQSDEEKIFLWAHSNGGMIALCILEISGKDYPASLWAPVSQFFPYDILYYTFEFEDKGKALRKSLADFEKDYDTEKYSFDNYLDWIKAPVQIQQGGKDEYVPYWWSERLVTRLKEKQIKVRYYFYPDSDHNLKQDWEEAVKKDLDFFDKYTPGSSSSR